MAVEMRVGLSRRESRRLRIRPETVYTNVSGTTEYRVAVARGGEFPHPSALIVHRFDYTDGQWRQGSDGGRFTNSETSHRSIAMMAMVKGCNRRRV